MTGNLESELLPPALEAAFRVVAEAGAIGVDDLARRLSGQGSHQSPGRLLLAPERFPTRFALDSHGRLGLATSTPKYPPANVDEDKPTTSWLEQSLRRLKRAGEVIGDHRLELAQ